MKFIGLLFFIGFLYYGSSSQTVKRKCATDEVHRQKMLTDPEYREGYLRAEKFIQKFVAENPNYKPKSVVTIPVVFHIVLSPSQHQQFPDTRVYEQMQVLNRDYAGQNPHSMGPFSPSLKANTEIQFCLATVDPQGNPTTGIERRNYSGPPWGTNSGVKYYSQGGLDAWDPNRYLNIWVCDLGGGLCGYALYPTIPLSNEFGLVQHWEFTGLTGAVAPYNLGGTATHESGHCFSLKHIWGDSPGCSPDDQCNDTPLQDVETYGNPTPPLTDQCSPNPPGIMFMNFMDYVDDIAYANFTPDQKTRMHACFVQGGPLYQLAQSNACGSSSGTVHVDFVASQTNIPVGTSINFTDLSTGNPTNWQWTFQGGTPNTSTVQHPTNIQYNTIGTYWVKLKAWNSVSSDSLTKYNYIHVYDPNAIVADFVGNPTTILKGQSVQFTDLSSNGPTSWQWQFPGGTPPFSTLQHPLIQYNTPGVYSVTLTASNANYTDTETKQNYITVLDSTDLPQANFVADYTTILVGNNVNFTNLSTGYYDSLLWIFEGGNPATSTSQNPANINYAAVGNYDVTLILYSFLGNDTLVKQDYIHVIDSTQITPIKADFHAITPRLITQGGSVSFEDLSIGPVLNWKWIFEGGNPNISTIQNPANIVYSTPGIYDVTLIVSNGLFSDTLKKEDYIVVTTEPWPDPYGFCDTITNIKQGEFPLMFINLYPTKWGYIPGHNGYQIKYYADKFVNYTFDNIRALIVPPVKAYGADNDNKVRFTIWEYDTATGLPGNVLAYKDKTINSFTPYIFTPVEFNTPVQVNGKFFVGFQLWYNNPVDTFVVYMAPNRGANGNNTLYLKKANNWITLSQFFNDTLKYNTSLAIRVVGCVVGINALTLKERIIVYPNPTKNFLILQLVDLKSSVDKIKLFDIVGKDQQVKVIDCGENSLFYIDISELQSGIYILNTNINGYNFTHRIIKH
ncbi:MAG: PKD domain-containing protein [Bacteroidales bacterium]|nr:PKD domain-containing protein [Bacteroidales bacterium]